MTGRGRRDNERGNFSPTAELSRPSLEDRRARVIAPIPACTLPRHTSPVAYPVLMSRLEHPFSTFVKQQRPLQAKLDEYAQPLADRLRAVHSLADLASLEREVDEILASAQQPSFLLGGRRTASIRPGEWATGADGTKVVVNRHYVAVQVLGDVFLSCTWPSDSEDLVPANDSRWPESELSTLDARDDVWTVGFDDQREDGEWALYTYLDLTLEDEARIAAGEIDPSLIIEERISRITPIVDRIDRDLVQFTRTFPDRMSTALSSRRQELTNRMGLLHE